jgi:Holliday junction resolvase
MSNANKNKGKSFEREVAELFSEATGLNWQRVPNSGAFIGGKNVTRINQMSNNQILLTRGDIIPPDEYNGICIECKFYKDFAFHQLFEDSLELNKWIDQCMVDYEKSNGKVFMVIFKINRKGAFICTLKEQFEIKKSLTYINKNREYSVSKFDLEWISNHKSKIKKLCQNEVHKSS